MTDANIAKVIRLLDPQEEGVKPITKKDACQILGMSYNTVRLSNVIEEYKERKAKDAKRRAELRGKPATKDEICYVISEYLGGETIQALSKITHRGPQFIKDILESNSVPIRVPGHSYFRPELIPDGAVRERFKLGEKVYSARYDSIAVIDTEKKSDPYGWVYRIWLPGESLNQYAYQPAYELASLQHLVELGVAL